MMTTEKGVMSERLTVRATYSLATDGNQTTGQVEFIARVADSSKGYALEQRARKAVSRGPRCSRVECPHYWRDEFLTIRIGKEEDLEMTYVALELLTKDANTYPLSNMIGAGGPSPAAPGVFEALLSDLQWPDIRAYLDRQGLPYKFSEPSTASRVARNSPGW